MRPASHMSTGGLGLAIRAVCQQFVVADGADLPFADGSLDAVRIDRSLQHIAEPGRVVREMARVARHGALVLCSEPDWGTFLLGGTHTAVTERIQHD